MELAESLFKIENNNVESYVELRRIFNEDKSILPQYKAAIFLFLNRHCFNGLCRYNKSGSFNVPFGKLSKPPKLDSECIETFSEALRKAVMTNLSFEDVLKEAGSGDVVYCDPPYSPLEQKTNFTSYSGNGFGGDIQIELSILALEASERGALVIISNHDTPSTRALYSKASSIESFGVHRSISRDGEGRKEVSELLATYLPKNQPTHS